MFATSFFCGHVVNSCDVIPLLVNLVCDGEHPTIAFGVETIHFELVYELVCWISPKLATSLKLHNFTILQASYSLVSFGFVDKNCKEMSFMFLNVFCGNKLQDWGVSNFCICNEKHKNAVFSKKVRCRHPNIGRDLDARKSGFSHFSRKNDLAVKIFFSICKECYRYSMCLHLLIKTLCVGRFFLKFYDNKIHVLSKFYSIFLQNLL